MLHQTYYARPFSRYFFKNNISPVFPFRYPKPNPIAYPIYSIFPAINSRYIPRFSSIFLKRCFQNNFKSSFYRSIVLRAAFKINLIRFFLRKPRSPRFIFQRLSSVIPHVPYEYSQNPTRLLVNHSALSRIAFFLPH